LLEEVQTLNSNLAIEDPSSSALWRRHTEAKWSYGGGVISELWTIQVFCGFTFLFFGFKSADKYEWMEHLAPDPSSGKYAESDGWSMT